MFNAHPWCLIIHLYYLICFNHLRAMCCRRDVVTLLWFCQCMGARPLSHHHLVNMIQSKLLLRSSSNFIHIFIMKEWTIFNLELRGHRSRSEWTIWKIILWVWKRSNHPVYLCQGYYRACRGWKDDPYWFSESKVKVIMGNRVQTVECILISLGTHVANDQWMNLIDF